MSRGLPGPCLASICRIRTRKPRAFSKCTAKPIPEIYQSRREFATSRYDEVSEANTQPVQPDEQVEPEPLPRWKATPPRMTAPFRSKPPTLKPNDFAVNEDPERLDNMYVKMLGKKGDKVLTEEVKWLAVTHKSFDHGRRGYNDRLAFLGKRIVELQASLAILTTASNKHPTPLQPDSYGRVPFQHAALENLETLNERSKEQVLDTERMFLLAERYGLPSVVRWKPKNIRNMKGSGQPLVMGQALYAIVGAVAFEKGGEFANKIVQDRILDRLGLRQQQY